ncbi:hypothetical protein Tco_0912165 [Tanacetum coccineum]
MNTDAKSGRSGIEVVASEVVGIVVSVVCYREGMTRGGGGGMVEVFIREAILSTFGEGLSRFRSLLVKSDETEELYIVWKLEGEGVE